MALASARGTLLLAALLSTAAPTYAQQETEGRKQTLSQFSDELASCYAYCQTISQCLGGPEGARNPANLSLSQQYAIRAKTLRRLAFLFSESAGRADAATSAFIDHVIQNVMQRIRWKCVAIASVVNEHGEDCQELAEHPDERLEMLLDRNP
jgi:hypothetical protein